MGKKLSGHTGGYIFKDSDFAPNNVALIPTQIYSSILDFVHFFLLLYVAKHKKADGQVAACYLICYSIGRFVIEFFRGDIERGSVGILSTSQFISIFTAIAGAILLLTVCEKYKTGSVTDQYLYSYEVRQIFAASAGDLPRVGLKSCSS